LWQNLSSNKHRSRCFDIMGMHFSSKIQIFGVY
jgi:hypothetical protein